MATVLITGGTGLIGSAITRELLGKGYDVTILTRFPEKYTNTRRVSYAGWDIDNQTIDENAVMKADHIIHLAGSGLADKRWTGRRKKQILESRTKGSELIVRALAENENKVKTVTSASGIGWYGGSTISLSRTRGTGKDPFMEADPPGHDFLGHTCREWESSIDPVSLNGKRLIKLRMGIVLSNEGGAFLEFKKPLRFGLATILASGKQVVSWIHIEDLARLYVYAIENEKIEGIYNAVAPYPVTNKNLVLELARQSKGKYFVPVYVPSFLLKLLFGELSIEVLKSAAVSSEKIRNAGFTFLYPSIKSAIQKLMIP